MQIRQRIAACLLTLSLMASAGCAAQTQEAAQTPAASDTQSEQAAAPAAPVTPGEDITRSTSGVEPDAVIATLDGNEAPAELLTYQIGYCCAYLNYMLQSNGMAGLDLSADLPDGQNTAQYVYDESVEMLKQQLVLENLTAQYGVTLSAEDEAAIAQQRASDIAEYGEDGYREELRKLGLSEAGYERVVRASYLYRALQTFTEAPDSPLYTSDEALADFAAAQGYITADHILLPTIDSATRQPLSEEEAAANRALAADLLAQLRASDDPVALFQTLADEYSQDPGRAANPTGYTFAEGEMVTEFDAAARALEENAISDVVESTYGCHIILRRPLDAAAAAEAVRGSYFDSFFLDAVSSAEMTLSPDAARLDVAAIYDAIAAAQADGAADSSQENPFAP
ncbi:MAG: peptidylprolyl isomerase [Oscillospiraceae bacterium]|nr:peptidylprolyl isomerase [Oscillospiraceae bacterium]